MNSDTRPTAYALGELTGADRDAFERELAASPALQAEVQALGALADELTRLPADESDHLTDAQRTTILGSCSVGPATTGPSHFSRTNFRQLAAVLALAACVIVACVIAIRHTPLPSESSSALAATEHKVDAPVSFGRATAASPLTEGALLTFNQSPGDVAFRQKLAERQRTEASLAAAASPTVDVRSVARKPAQVILPAIPSIASVDDFNPAMMASTARGVTYAPAAPRQYHFVPAQPGEADRSGILGDVPPIGRFVPVDAAAPAPHSPHASTESYAPLTANIFQTPTEQPLSTFSIDVDTASYANVRRFLQAGQRPPADAVRLEELLNYFPTTLPSPANPTEPFSLTTDVTRPPWAEDRLLARIALKGRELAADALPPSNLVFLVDVSGSMNAPDKLPLLQRSLTALVERLRPEDRVAIVTYAGRSGLALESTPAREKTRILAAIDALAPGGSTNGASGITLAYQTAREHFLKEGNNRVILCTDGDFNVGITSRDELTALIERERRSGVFLSVLGFGTGNLKDDTMELLANKGNGNYAYIDSPAEGRKVLVQQMGGTLFTIAKDVKIQVEFNPATIAGYRLLGYENRLLAKEDFNDDTKDAGEIGAGHSVTALYEIIPAGQPLPNDRRVDPLKYQGAEAQVPNPKVQIPKNASEDLFTVKLRYKAPDGDRSQLLEKVVGRQVTPLTEAPADFRFLSAVAAFGMNLRQAPGDSATEWSAVQRIARDAMGDDPGAYRAEFLTLVERARDAAP